MSLNKSFLVAFFTGFALILLFLAPWTNYNIAFLNLGTGNGLEMAKEFPVLYGVPIIGIISIVIAWAGLKEILAEKFVALILMIIGLLVSVYLILAMTSWYTVEVFGLSMNFGEAGWGLWLTLISSVVLVISGLLGLLEVDN